jgi:hypothetical protein
MPLSLCETVRYARVRVFRPPARSSVPQDLLGRLKAERFETAGYKAFQYPIIICESAATIQFSVLSVFFSGSPPVPERYVRAGVAKICS